MIDACRRLLAGDGALGRITPSLKLSLSSGVCSGIYFLPSEKCCSAASGEDEKRLTQTRKSLCGGDAWESLARSAKPQPRVLSSYTVIDPRRRGVLQSFSHPVGTQQFLR
jgi:hypothetical protein